MSVEFRSLTNKSDAGIVIRTWTGVGGWPDKGYRIRLGSDSLDRPSSILVGPKMAVAVIEEGRLDLRPPNEWQKLDVTGDGRRIRIGLNGTLAGIFDVDSYGGHILFVNGKGRVQFRNITIVSTEGEGQTDAMPPNVVRSASERQQPGFHSPTLVREVKPNYTPEARKREVAGRVDLEAVVLADGSVGGVRVMRSLDPNLDLAAIAAVRAWKFKPAVFNGLAVPCMVEVEMTFTLK